MSARLALAVWLIFAALDSTPREDEGNRALSLAPSDLTTDPASGFGLGVLIGGYTAVEDLFGGWSRWPTSCWRYGAGSSSP